MKKTGKAYFASRVGANYEVLRQISKENKKAGALMAKRIEKESYGIVTRASLRPDIFGE